MTPLEPVLVEVGDAFIEAKRKARRLWQAVWVIVSFGLLYMGASLGIMIHLYHEDRQACESRQAGRETVRTIFEHTTGWTIEAQTYMDEQYPPLKC